mmetsp:Transcript_1554/g.2076  ORF Transcript_1554/g.2076 Transcript_1554/m.2076 type:complete len:137 (+) Transcript_1554:327-737(+)
MMREFIAKREKALADKGTNTTITHIMLTSEEKKIIDSRLAFTNDSTFPYEFIVNDEDAAQGTGNPRAYRDLADHVMVSSLISTKMQLHTESVVFNGCSNFHKIMLDQSLHNCGVQNYFETYKDNDKPEYRLSCAWG